MSKGVTVKVGGRRLVEDRTMAKEIKWPDAAPLDGEELIFSIYCGDSHLHWAIHFGDAVFSPQIFGGEKKMMMLAAIDVLLIYSELLVS